MIEASRIYTREDLLPNCIRPRAGVTCACTFAMTTIERECMRGITPTEEKDDGRRHHR